MWERITQAEKGKYWGVSPGPGPLQSIGNIRHEPKLFGRLQLRCGLSLSLLQQLVINLRRHAWHKMRPTVTYLRSGQCVSVLSTLVSTAETEGPIEMPFGDWTRVGPRNHALRGARPLGGHTWGYPDLPAVNIAVFTRATLC